MRLNSVFSTVLTVLFLSGFLLAVAGMSFLSFMVCWQLGVTVVGILLCLSSLLFYVILSPKVRQR